MKKRIIVFNGGLGNQLFQYVYMLYLWKNGICTPLYNTSLYKKYTIHAGFEADKVFDFSVFQKNEKDFTIPYSLEKRCEKYLHRHLLFAEECSANSIDFRPLFGYWQNIMYYQAVEPELQKRFLGLDRFCTSDPFLDAVQKTESVFIHVRRGDYCGNCNYQDLSSTNYYQQAIACIQDNVKNPCFFVFSDDITWCKGYFKDYPKMHFVEYDGQTALGDLAIMLKCRYAIIANSSFSWWGTALKSKTYVIYPRKNYINSGDQPLYRTQWIGI